MASALPETVCVGGRFPVRRIGLGTIDHAGAGVWGPPTSPAQCIDVLRSAVAFGVNFIDTAHAYGPGVAEELIAQALHPYPDDLLIATKGGFSRPGPREWVVDCRPVVLRRQIDESLRRLRVDCLDLWQLHRVDPKVPLAEQLGVALEAQRAGKVRLFGLSKVDTTQIDEAARLVPVATVQNRFNVADQASHSTVDHCLARGIVFIAWAPLAVGQLARQALATARHGAPASAAQLALGWLLQRAPNILAIPGTTSIEHLRENVSALGSRMAKTDWTDYFEAVQNETT